MIIEKNTQRAVMLLGSVLYFNDIGRTKLQLLLEYVPAGYNFE